MKRIIVIFIAFTLMFSIGCNEELVMDTVPTDAPVIVGFEPNSGRLGDEIEITGEFLGDINQVYFNNDSTAIGTITQLVNNNKIIVKVAKESISGPITVKNTLGVSTTSESFTVDYPVPTIGDFVDTARTYEFIEVQGTNMDVVNEVLFGNSPGLIMETWPNVLVVRVPFYWEETVKINLTYNNAGTVEMVSSTKDFVLNRVEPEFSTTPTSFNVDITNTLLGKNLSVIDTLMLDSIPVDIINQQDDIIQFRIPEGLYDVSTEGVKISFIYNIGFQNKVLENPVKVVVPLLRVLDFKLKNRSNSTDHFADFITGSKYDMCTSWEFLQPNISMLAYASKSGYIQLRSPHNAGTVIKNYKCGGLDEGALPQENGIRYSMMKRLQADDVENGALHAKYIDLVQSGAINEVLDDPAFIAEMNTDLATINPNSASLNFYNDESLSTFDPAVQPQVAIGDVIALKHIDIIDDVYVYSYGFIQLTGAFADVGGNIGSKDTDVDGSYLQFDVYLIKELSNLQ